MGLRTTGEIREQLSRLPSVDEVLRSSAASLLARHPRSVVRDAVRAAIARRREEIARAEKATGARVRVSEADVQRELAAREAPRLRRVINATGVVLHTNLGRAPLGEAVLRRVLECGRGYVNLEYDLAARARGGRADAYRALLCEVTGAESALCVNNNAGAMLLALAALAAGGEVVVSRGELVEIGGSFRIPDVLAASGARLREVGTTNRTRLSDYQAAVGPETRALLKVHRSNFALVGFTEEPSMEELAAVARARGLPSLFDLGSGSMLDLAVHGLRGEVPVRDALRAGFDLVAFSGDKLLGGPQAGIIVGRAPLIAELAKHPLHRALRLDRLRTAALEETLRIYRSGDDVARAELPVLGMLTAPADALRARALSLGRRLRRATRGRGFAIAVAPRRGAPGGGSFPGGDLESWAVSLSHPRLSCDEIEAGLRGAEPPILARVSEGAVWLDVRTLFPEELALVARAVSQIEVAA